MSLRIRPFVNGGVNLFDDLPLGDQVGSVRRVAERNKDYICVGYNLFTASQWLEYRDGDIIGGGGGIINSTSDVPEGGNYYFTTDRVNSAIASYLGLGFTAGDAPGMSVGESGEINAPLYNGLAITPTTGGTLTIPNGATLTGSGTNTGDQTSVTGNSGTATAALGIKTATTTVSVSGATAPTAGQILVATNGTAATWQTPSGGSTNLHIPGPIGDTTPGTGSFTTLSANDTTTITGALICHNVAAAEFYQSNPDGVTIGHAAMSDPTSDGVTIGHQAGGALVGADGAFNVRVGRHAGYGTSGVYDSVFMGHAAGQYALDAANAVLIGHYAGRNINQDAGFHGNGATLVGPDVASYSVDVRGATILGQSAGLNAPTLKGAVVIGDVAARDVTDATESVIIGHWAGLSATNCQRSVLIGSYAGQSLSRNNTLIIDSNSTYSTGATALIYGEFDNRVLKLNAAVTATTLTIGTSLITLGGAFTTSGAYASTLTFTAATNVTFPTTGTLATRAGAETLTNKRMTKRVAPLTDAATVTLATDSFDGGVLATLSQATNFLLSGTLTDMQPYVLRIKSTTARAITWDAAFAGSTDQALPATTSGGGLTDLLVFNYDLLAGKMRLAGKNFGGA